MTTIQTDKAFEIMMKILPDVAAIMNDGEADDIIKRVRGDGVKNVETGDAMNALVPLFASKYKHQLYNIVAAFEGCNAEEVGKQDITKTITTLATGLRVMSGFFGCCLHMARNM